MPSSSHAHRRRRSSSGASHARIPGRPAETRDFVAKRNQCVKVAVQVLIACLVGAGVALLAVTLPGLGR